MADRKLLTISADAKTVKGESKGYRTAILYLAPHTLAGVGNLCPNASPDCIALCLNTAGRGIFDSIQTGRIRRTREFHADRAGFVRRIVREIAAHVRKCARDGYVPVVRLNGTSDLPWENITDADGGRIMALFPNVQFYDYTKSPRRMAQYLAGALPHNYHLTFSRSECNEALALRILADGGNVAVVFSTRKGETLPRFWQGFRVLDGDESDLRFLDVPVTTDATSGRPGYVIGLRAKGKARRKVGGFVVDARPSTVGFAAMFGGAR